jgi:hypothetical protein
MAVFAFFKFVVQVYEESKHPIQAYPCLGLV